jgi:RNA polymerase sigma-70 factor, ECF subfamily
MLKEIKFKTLVNQHKNRIYNYSYYMLGNRMDADDITQEVLIRTWKNIDNFNFSSAKSWMMKTTHNLCIDYLRRNKNFNMRNNEINEKLETRFVATNHHDSYNPDVILYNKSIDSMIKEAIMKLPENLKSPFVCYQLEGMKYKEISDTLNIPLNSVKVYIMRARKKLQNELKEIIYEKVYRSK